MKLTANDLMKLGVVDEVIKEPLGGAHRDNEKIASDLKRSILNNLKIFEKQTGEQIYNQRKSKFLKIGRDQGFGKTTEEAYKSLSYKDSGIFGKIIDKKNILIFALVVAILTIIFML